jgi:CRP-like cAMP-binding protein
MDQVELLKRIYIFKGAASKDLDALSAIVERKVYVAGELIYHEGDAADAFFVIETGSVDLLPKGKSTLFGTVASGQSLGELPFFDQGMRAATASPRERTDVLRIAYEKFSKLLAERPEFALIVYRNTCAFFAKHLRGMSAGLSARYF